MTLIAGMATSKPHTEVSEYTIRIASREQEEQHWRAQFSTWHRGQSWQDFKAECGRQCVRLDTSRIFRVWVLVRRDDLGGRIYTGCETFRRDAFIRLKGRDNVKETTVYNIHSVATPLDVLRRGFATHLLRLLHYTLADQSHLPPFPSEWGAPPSLTSTDRSDLPYGTASTLYSDVGLTFYERCTIGRDLPGSVMRDEENQEVVWNVLPALTPDKEWDWIYEKELYEDKALMAEVQAAAKAKLQHVDATCETAFVTDPASPFLLGDVATRCLDIRPPNWPYARQTEPVGVRLKAKNDNDPDALVIFSWSDDMIGPRVLLLHTANLTAELVPEALEAMDVVGHAAGRKHGWVFGPSADDPFTRAVAAIPGRLAGTGRRAEIDGHLLAVAWYGAQTERGRILDLDMLSW